ncbi:unnamed protein product [Porites lobata]|uniref:Uncharacterized protein n=1 Tax=Porites lobata TaxID=104759 RepID=A0ABN8QTL6_9CNID|nr:unnamed protein product [Porites lobata]
MVEMRGPFWCMRLCCCFCFQRNHRVTNGGSTYRECLERLLSVSTNFNKEALKQAVAMKFQNYLSRHKFNLVCRMQSSVYDAEQEYYFIFQFSDDGAPEKSEPAMSTGTLTRWNLGSRVKSREFHSLLNFLSVSEKESAMEDIRKQHNDEMRVLEGNILTVRGQQCTLEFQPSTDQSW